MNICLPYALQVEITSQCNLSCKMCPLGTKRTLSSLQPGHMTEVVWKDIASMTQKVGLMIMAGYGEILANPKYLTFLQEIDDSGTCMTIATNGIGLTSSVSKELAMLKHLVHINISIDSPDPDIYHKIRGGKIRKALNGVENLMSVIDDPWRVSVSSVLMSKNVASLAAFPSILSKLGVKRYILQGLIDYNSMLHEKHLLYTPNASLYLEKIEKACKEAGIKLVFALQGRFDLELREALKVRNTSLDSTNSSSKGTKQCCRPWEFPFIDKDGKVFPCCYASTVRAPIMGNLRKMSIIEIWQGDVYQKFRQALLDGNMPTVCQSCNVFPVDKAEHVLKCYSAKILFEKSVIGAQTEICLVVRNTGSCAWTQDTSVQIGTTNPRDRKSIYFHPTWLSFNRVATFTETIVPPGGIATFNFQIKPTTEVRTEVFQLVVDGRNVWMLNTQFEICLTKISGLTLSLLNLFDPDV